MSDKESIRCDKMRECVDAVWSSSSHSTQDTAKGMNGHIEHTCKQLMLTMLAFLHSFTSFPVLCIASICPFGFLLQLLTAIEL